MMLEAAAESDGLKAVVSEGAGIRSVHEALAIPETSAMLQASLVHAVVTPGVALFSNTLPPPSLEDLVARIAPRPVFIIYAKPGQGGEAELSQKLLRRSTRAEDDLAGARRRAHRRDRGAAGRVRATRHRVLRRCAPWRQALIRARGRPRA